MRGIFVAALIGCLLPPNLARAEQLFLTVAASSRQPAAIAAVAARLAPVAPRGFVVATGDCGDTKPAVAFVAAVSATREDARKSLNDAQAFASDAYLKPCRVRPGSLLALRIGAVDPSISGVPKDAVNWTDADRITTPRPMDGSAFLVTVRRYIDVPNDPLEGRRSRVLLARPGKPAVTLTDTCFDPGSSAVAGNLIALECAREQAAGHVLHGIEVITREGRHLMDIPRCGAPAWAELHVLVCGEEQVSADGTLTSHRKRVPVAER